jgi:hypothetical protein
MDPNSNSNSTDRGSDNKIFQAKKPLISHQNSRTYQTFRQYNQKKFFDDLPVYTSKIQAALGEFELLSIRNLLEALSIHDDKYVWKFLKGMIDACQQKIGISYALNASTNSMLYQTHFDVCIAIHKTFRTLRDLKQQLACIQGFLIVELGECKRYPKQYTINLICAPSDTFKAAPLLGAYLFLAKRRKQKLGILELAGKYGGNIAGFCSYDKFGFRENVALYKRCFNDTDKQNLPMTVILNNLSYDDIIQIVTTQKRLPKLEDNNPNKICTWYMPEKKNRVQEQLQTELIYLYDDRATTNPNDHTIMEKILHKIDTLEKIILVIKRRDDIERAKDLLGNYLNHYLSKKRKFNSNEYMGDGRHIWVTRILMIINQPQPPPPPPIQPQVQTQPEEPPNKRLRRSRRLSGVSMTQEENISIQPRSRSRTRKNKRRHPGRFSPSFF